MAYDFKAARKRREELVSIYRGLKHLHDDMWAFGVMAQIEEIDREIEEAHRSNAVVLRFPIKEVKNEHEKGQIECYGNPEIPTGSDCSHTG